MPQKLGKFNTAKNNKLTNNKNITLLFKCKYIREYIIFFYSYCDKKNHQENCFEI